MVISKLKPPLNKNIINETDLKNDCLTKSALNPKKAPLIKNVCARAPWIVTQFFKAPFKASLILWKHPYL